MRHPERTLVMGLMVGLLGGCSTSEGEGPRNVVLICMDTVRADHIGCYGHDRNTTPALDALAERSLVFLDTCAASGWTKPSVPSYFTGTFPLQHGVYDGSARSRNGERSDVLPAASTTLAEVFHDRGYATAAFLRNAQLRPGLGFEQGFDTYVDEAGDARRIRELGEAWIAEHASEDEPFFLYLHFLDAHWPYPVPDAYAERFADGHDVNRFRDGDSAALRKAVHRGQVTLDGQDVETLEALYDGAIRYIDDELAQLFSTLAAQGLAEDTVVCIVSDHGEEFLEHGRLGHGHGLWENLLRVPWILHVPGRAAARHTNPVSLVDLFPTLLAAAQVPAPRTHVGVDRLSEPGRERPIFAEHKGKGEYIQSWRFGDRKWIRKVRPTPPDTEGLHPSIAVQRGTRWEAEVSPDGGGGWLANKIKPREEPPATPFEVKGPLAKLDDGRVTLAGIPLVLTDDATFYGDAPEGASGDAVLVDGAWFKAKGSFKGDVFHTSRVKVYADAGATPRTEFRGRVEDIELDDDGTGRLRVGPIWVRFTSTSEWDLDLEELLEESIDREVLVARLGELAAGRDARDATVTQLEFNVTSDAGETAGAPVAATKLPAGWGAFLEARLDQRTFGASDQRTLDEGALRDLRAIGYGGE